MAAIPPPSDTLADRIYKALESKSEPSRGHLGASQIGHHCDRYLWLSFRWACPEQFQGRILRLFRRGHEEEAGVISDLRAAGCEVMDTDGTGRQYGFRDGHFAGSIDGIVLSGVPEAPNKPHVLEAKTHSLKSFNDVVAKGVKASKPMHYAQMQTYMARMSVDRALYFAVCKDDDRIYTERVRFDKEEAERLADRAQRIIASDRMPEPISADPTWYQCKFCAAADLCHGNKRLPDINCRTCAHFTAERDGRATCARWGDIPDIKAQQSGCDAHVIHPDLVPWQYKPTEQGTHLIYIIDGKEVLNGEPPAFTSREIVANPLGCANADSDFLDMRIAFDARVVG
jgi:CRISPR/Cas system-associated exonuclease Cas4 (RecB family)